MLNRFAHWYVLRRLRRHADAGTLTSSIVDRARANITAAAQLMEWAAGQQSTLSGLSRPQLENYLTEQAERARRRARRSGSGERRCPVVLATTSTAVPRSTRHPGCTTSGRTRGRVRIQQPTTVPPRRSRLVSPRRSSGHSP